MKYSYFSVLIFILIIFGCSGNGEKREDAEDTQLSQVEKVPIEVPDTIIDADYTFLQSVEGSNAPSQIIQQLELIDVYYTSIDGLTHKGQILTNKLISEDIRYMFNYMQEQGFVVDKVIPIVRYGWSDSLSMDDNNTYSFCYRNITYSKHAKGMAIDINPRFNPLRYKLEDKPNMPVGAVLDTTVNGTLHPEHAVVKEFRSKGFRWGHTFTRYYDDHHFEKR